MAVIGSSRRERVTTRKVGPQIIETVPVSPAPPEFGEDEQGERIAPNAGEVFTEQIGRSTDVAGGRGADNFNVMAFPTHRATAGGTRRCFGQGVEIGGCEPEARIGRDRLTERRYSVGRSRGLLRLPIEGGGLDVCCDRSSVILDRETSGRGRLGTPAVGLFRVMHDR